jgi:hypothetical protein
MYNPTKSDLESRRERGNEILTLVWGPEPLNEERESAAADAISDILTALYGPAGHYEDTGPDEIAGFYAVWNETALRQAEAMLSRSEESWRGDAEDYGPDDVAS